MRKIILGSASPRRKELLNQIGIEFDIRVSDREEHYNSNIPEEIVKELALMKAENVAEDAVNDGVKDAVVIGADTVVVYDGHILGKPRDDEDAFKMIRSFAGEKHYVYTGIAIADIIDGKINIIVNEAVKTDVYVNNMTNDEIKDYIMTGEHKDKAGAYGIQGRFAAYIDHIDGDYYNVVGLPVSKIYENLKKYDII